MARRYDLSNTLLVEVTESASEERMLNSGLIAYQLMYWRVYTSN